MRLSPGNADYRHRLGRYFAFVAGDPQSAINSSASRRRAQPSRCPLLVRSGRRLSGHRRHRRPASALDRALQAEPTAPDVAWEAANFFLIDGDIDRALREFHVVIENDISLVDASLRACWRVRPDTDALLRDAVPPQFDALLAFLHFLMSKQETEGTIKTWERLAQICMRNSPTAILYEYVSYLIGAHRPDAAMSAWEETADVLGLSAYLPTDDNLVVNGDFSLDILNGGFDWTYVNRTGVQPLLDPSDFPPGTSLAFSHLRRPGHQRRGNSTTHSGARPNHLRFLRLL